MKTISYNNSFFTYYLSNKKIDYFDNVLNIGSLYLSYSNTTEVISAQLDERYLFVLGFCIDAHDEIKQDSIPDFLLSNSSNLNNILSVTIRLAGRYLIFYQETDKLYIIPDGISSVSTFYTTAGEVNISSNEKIISNIQNLSPSEYGLNLIKNCTSRLPGDSTIYDNIRILLPNHYLDVYNHTSVRFHIGLNINNLTIEDKCGKIKELSINIAKQCLRKYNLCPPLTGGHDSRLSAAIILAVNSKVVFHTIRHPTLNINSPDLVVPAHIKSTYNLNHFFIHVPEVPEDFNKSLKSLIDINCFFESLVPQEIYSRINSKEFNNNVTIGGAIIDQIGRASKFGNIPNWMVKTWIIYLYYGSFNRNVRKEIKLWIKDTKSIKQDILLHDLISWEERCGRWASNTSKIYDTGGLMSLNLFNCYEIIYLMVKIPRKDRENLIIYNTIFQSLYPEFLDIPFNPILKESKKLRHTLLHELISNIYRTIKIMSAK